MDDFLKACGATGPLQLLVENRGLTAMRWNAPQPFALIGRDPAMDLYLDHPRIDGRHAYLQVIEGGVYCVDLGSQTGTRWENGTARIGWLNHPQGIGIGPYVIQLAPEGREASGSTPEPAVRPDPQSSRPPDSDDLPRVVLEFRRAGAKPIRWRMRHVLTLVGTSPHCKVRLASPGVSPFHCSLLRTAAGMWVVNLLGQGGVTVNGSSVRASRLEAGDELMIGDILVRVIADSRTALDDEARSLAVDERGQATLLTHPHPAMTSRALATNRSNAAWPAPACEAGNFLAEPVAGENQISASLLALVLDQFGEMQQQFLNQFQQTALMMFRALGNMHREQMEELREKLDSLHQLGENLQELQAQMSSSVAPGPGRAAREEVAAASDPFESDQRPDRDASRNGRANPWEAAKARETQTRPAAENGTDPLRQKVRPNLDPPNLPSANVHEWLIGRLAALEDEQRTRWQKIFDLVRGK